MRIDHPKNRKFVVCRSEDGSVLHRVSVGPEQSMATGQPVVEQTESEVEHVGHLAPYADQFPPLPDEGEPVEAGEIYAHGDGLVMARQSHPRTEHDPADVLALFVVYREGAEGLDWVPSETVDVGTLREYYGSTYRAIQGHTTQEGWQPPNVPALWESVNEETEPTTEPDTGPTLHPTFEAGIDVVVGDVYVYEGIHYRVMQAHTTADHWSPPAAPSLWLPVVNVNRDDSTRLQTLSGVGASLAQKIIDDRPYDTVDDLTRVSGISQSMIDGWEVIV